MGAGTLARAQLVCARPRSLRGLAGALGADALGGLRLAATGGAVALGLLLGDRDVAIEALRELLVRVGGRRERVGRDTTGEIADRERLEDAGSLARPTIGSAWVPASASAARTAAAVFLSKSMEPPERSRSGR